MNNKTETINIRITEQAKAFLDSKGSAAEYVRDLIDHQILQSNRTHPILANRETLPETQLMGTDLEETPKHRIARRVLEEVHDTKLTEPVELRLSPATAKALEKIGQNNVMASFMAKCLGSYLLAEARSKRLRNIRYRVTKDAVGDYLLAPVSKREEVGKESLYNLMDGSDNYLILKRSVGGLKSDIDFLRGFTDEPF